MLVLVRELRLCLCLCACASVPACLKSCAAPKRASQCCLLYISCVCACACACICAWDCACDCACGVLQLACCFLWCPSSLCTSITLKSILCSAFSVAMHLFSSSSSESDHTYSSPSASVVLCCWAKVPFSVCVVLQLSCCSCTANPTVDTVVIPCFGCWLLCCWAKVPLFMPG